MICWIFLWASINVELFRVFNFGNNFSDNVNGIRAILPSIILFYIFFYLLFRNLLIKFFNKNNFYLIFLFFFFCQIIGGIGNLNNILVINKYIAIQSLGLVIGSIATILLIYLIHNEDSTKIEEFLVYFTIAILGIYFIPLLVNLMWEYSLSSNVYAYHETLIQENSKDLLKLPLSRSTGISRSILIITIFFLCFNSFKNKKLKIFISLIIFILTISIFLINSKFATLSLIIIYSLIICTNKLYYNHKKKNLLFFIIIPFFFSQLIFNIKSNIISNNSIHSKQLDLKVQNRFIDDYKKQTVGFTSGRTDIWAKSINIFISKKKYIFGLGSQADRIYLTSEKDVWSNNSSNIIIYSLLSGGIISVILLFLFNYIILTRIYKYFFSRLRKANLNYNLINFSIFTYLFLLLRSFVENSFGLFSIDFLIYSLSCLIILKNINNKNQNN